MVDGVLAELAAEVDRRTRRRVSTRLVVTLVGVLVVAGVVAWGMLIGTTSTVTIGTKPPRLHQGTGQDPASGAIVWPDVCHDDNSPHLAAVEVVGHDQDYVSADALQVGPYAASPFPPGDQVRVTRRWFRAPEYVFVADDGTTVPLHELHKFWAIPCTGP